MSKAELRDYFAGQVLAGLFAACGNVGDPEVYADFADTAYKMADAMVERRLRFGPKRGG